MPVQGYAKLPNCCFVNKEGEEKKKKERTCSSKAGRLFCLSVAEEGIPGGFADHQTSKTETKVRTIQLPAGVVTCFVTGEKKKTLTNRERLQDKRNDAPALHDAYHISNLRGGVFYFIIHFSFLLYFCHLKGSLVLSLHNGMGKQATQRPKGDKGWT